jgi:hypothetical protein
VTTTTHAAGPDWKVTTGYRVMLRIAWCMVILSVYGAGVAVLVGFRGVWWVVAGLAASAMLVAALLPEPVPADLITEARSRLDATRAR